MESNTEVLRIVGAIVSAFQTAADILEVIKDRKDKKKRKKDKDIEELMELRILHKSLIEGETRCRKHCENRHRQYSPAFEFGDEIAITALKDVVIALQVEIIQALHLARAMESSVLDLTSLHESSITSCRDATRAMDQLCQRIMASMQWQHQLSVGTSEAHSDSSVRSGFASTHRSDRNDSYSLSPLPPSSLGNQQQPYYQRSLSPLAAFPQRSSTIRHQNDMSSQRGRYNTSQPSPDMELERRSQVSVLSFADRITQYLQEPPNASQATHTYNLSQKPSQQWSEQSHVSMQQRTEQPQTTPQQQAPTYEETSTVSGSQERDHRYTFGQLALPTPEEKASAILSQTTRTARIETAQDHIRAVGAPEVLDASLLRHDLDLSSEKYPASRTQADYEDLLKTLPAGVDNIWQPLTRPAMHNRYHGFCKGAWQIRKAVHEGIEVQITPSLKEPVIHWACKMCKFRSKAPNADTLPDQIQFNQKYNIRYRWLFLAKSHRETQVPSDRVENYQYGCIFCAAQGKTTAVHEKLEHLMVHIISKHKSATMTTDIKRTTKCIVGGVAKSTANWDIAVPESNQKGSPSVTADEFFMSASKFFSRRKGKGS